MKPTDFAIYVSDYLSKYLPGMAGASENTIFSYRDMFTQLLHFYESELHMSTEKISVKQFNADNVSLFLKWLEQSRGNSAATRNIRLSSLHAFARFVERKNPAHMFEMQKILSIPYKRAEKGSLEYISGDAMKYLLAIPDIREKSGLRDSTLLSLLYDTGCRVQELCDLRVCDVRLASPPTVRLTGKGNKTRIVPMMPSMSTLLEQYLEKYRLNDPANSFYSLFQNRMGEKLTRKGVSYIVNKYFQKAKKNNPSLYPERLTPHCFRHSKSMHLLHAGVNLIYIRDLLGHVDIKTTEIYARIDSEMKRKALEKGMDLVSNNQQPVWQENKTLLEWLKNLG